MTCSISRWRRNVLRVAEEVRFYSPEQAAELLREALGVVESVAPPEDLRETVFNHAANLLAAGQRIVEQVGVAPSMMPVPGAHL